ncbi:RNA 3'-terminal phosphate cyclase-like protein isoform X1 [Petromyzon marinus]|uniref:RNA 3'-terminal phosphate cyclase-like protein isoform X1 n=2 Tax=Petromyzon marinus TaxID=7757 RepID=A0AAJ7XDI6_PETMA|nr:RNA 3'-terminal phosphate cyclase-like protein isoform X1 [Petromyzon marinus]
MESRLRYSGSAWLRPRLVLSVLSGRSVTISAVRARGSEPGLADFEVSLIRLLDKITNGSRIDINETGTMLRFHPGLLWGGPVEHECPASRSVGYFLEALLCLAPFCKTPLRASLAGATSGTHDPSVDVIKATALPLLRRFGIGEVGLDLQVLRRGMAPGGGGLVLFCCPVRRHLKPLQLTQPGKIKRIRGVAFGTRVSPQVSNRLVEAARGVLNRFLPDIYIHTDHRKGAQAGRSPGFGISLVAETTEGCFLSAESTSTPGGEGPPSIPEDLGRDCARLLLEEIYRGGCVDSTNQSLALLFMALGQQDVSKLLLGPLSPHTVGFLRHLRDYFSVTFKLEPRTAEEGDKKGGDKVLLTCVGIGFSNLSKTVS